MVHHVIFAFGGLEVVIFHLVYSILLLPRERPALQPIRGNPSAGLRVAIATTDIRLGGVRVCYMYQIALCPFQVTKVKWSESGLHVAMVVHKIRKSRRAENWQAHLNWIWPEAAETSFEPGDYVSPEMNDMGICLKKIPVMSKNMSQYPVTNSRRKPIGWYYKMSTHPALSPQLLSQVALHPNLPQPCNFSSLPSSPSSVLSSHPLRL